MEAGGAAGCGWVISCCASARFPFGISCSFGSWCLDGVGFGWLVSFCGSLCWLFGCSPVLCFRCLCFVRMQSCRLWAPFCLIVGTPFQWWVFRLFVGKYLLFSCAVPYSRASCCCRFVLPGGVGGCSSPCCFGPVLARFCRSMGDFLSVLFGLSLPFSLP